jgi:hypothetical protein
MKTFQQYLESLNLSHPNWTSSDGTVSGNLDIDTDFKYIGIFEWQSNAKGQGNTIKALQELKQQYPGFNIQIVNAVNPAYWLHMARKGLVDQITDENGVKLYP